MDNITGLFSKGGNSCFSYDNTNMSLYIVDFMNLRTHIKNKLARSPYLVNY